MKNIQFYYDELEKVIIGLGVDPAICRGQKPGQWNLKKGSANVWVDIWKLKDKDYGYFQVMAPIVQIPSVNKEEFFQEILEINHKLYGVGMTKYKDWIYLKAVRELDDLSENEIRATLNRIGTYADDYDDYLKNKYSNPAGGPPPGM